MEREAFRLLWKPATPLGRGQALHTEGPAASTWAGVIACWTNYLKVLGQCWSIYDSRTLEQSDQVLAVARGGFVEAGGTRRTGPRTIGNQRAV